MNGWMTSFNRKKHQRRMNKYVRELNKNIANDDLWRGRFVIHQEGNPGFYIYEDKSGAEMPHVHLVITDLKTGKRYDKWNTDNGWCHFNGACIWEFANYAITERFDVWRKNDDPRDNHNNPLYNFNNPKVREYWRKEWK
jgi:hypothetical protein